MDELRDRLTMVSAIYAVMIEDEKEDSTKGRELAAKWARLHEELARRLRTERVPKGDIRSLTLWFFLADLDRDVARAAREMGWSSEEILHWLDHRADATIARLPHLGRLRELLLQRLRNADGRWESGDLNDALFLSCAAGYADLVVGERKHINLLARAKPVEGRGAHLVSKLPAAVGWLEARGVLGAQALSGLSA